MINISLLVLVTALNVLGENATTVEEAEQIKALNEVKTLQIFGDLITIVAKNETDLNAKNCDDFDLYLLNHLIRIRSPLQEDKYLDFELNDLIPGNEVEGREKRDKRKGPIREILIPLLVALKYKSTVVLPLLMTMIAFVAFKAFWAGMTGLVISKVVGLKVLLQSLNKPEEDHEEHEEHGDDHVFYQNEEVDRSDNKPIVVYLRSNNQRRRRRISKRQGKPKRYFTWDWDKRQQNYIQANWINRPMNWEQKL